MLSSPETLQQIGDAGHRASAWRFAPLAFSLVAVAVLFWPTYASMPRVWLNSTNYLHCFLIPPLCLLQAWQQRRRLASTKLSPYIPGLACVAILVAVWTVAELAAVSVAAQLASVMLVGATVLSVAGRTAFALLAFPLGYLIFSVPFGDFLIPTLMDWTAASVVWSVKASGIPVYREGMYFYLPGGTFEVARACSGIRYLLATVVLGVYFSYESYRRPLARITFVVAAVAVAVGANFLRAYLLVVLAHSSNMQYGAGMDHWAIGWGVFALAISALFLIGSRYRDSATGDEGRENSGVSAALQGGTGMAAWAVSFATFLLALSGVFGAERLSAAAGPGVGEARLPANIPQWAGPGAGEGGFTPAYSDFHSAISGRFEKDGAGVELTIIIYDRTTGSELISWKNRVADESLWKTVYSGRESVVAGRDNEFAFNSIVVRGAQREVLVWYAYDIGGHWTVSPSVAKIYHALNILSARNGRDALIVVTANITGAEISEAETSLRNFVSLAGEMISACIWGSAGTECGAASGPGED